MLIKCPKCSKSNDLNFESAVNCGHCKAELSGHTYGRVKKSVAAVVIAFSAGSLVTKKVGEHYSPHRYDLGSEYAIVEACLNGSQQALGRSQYQGKREDCICALSEVQKKYGLKDLTDKTSQYLTAFDSAARSCRMGRTSLSYSR
ncbi:hypothetical protein [Pseudomonas sp.]|uniref:hypothetical protein n=1 Tax=Pseudomonas sp. TaxID=306 RepID=UPI0028AC7C18|nr:hypothetical protein [Pseudomonas sp.]